MTIFDALTQHHRKLKKLFADLAEDKGDFNELLIHLAVHHEIEEAVLYVPIIERETNGFGAAMEAVEEHQVVDMLLQMQKRFPRENRRWPVKLHVLQEYTEHHLDEEEEDIFPDLAKGVSEEEQKDMGEQFRRLLAKQVECRRM